MKFIKTTMKLKLVGITTLLVCIGFAIGKGILTEKIVASEKIIASTTVAVTPGKVYEILEVGTANKGKITNFFFNDDNGKKHSLLDITQGKYTFLNFWGTWCPPCRAEIPAIIELQTELKSEGLIVIGIAMERPNVNAMEVVSNYAKNRNINYINFVATREIIGKISESYGGISAIPTTFLANRAGEISEKIDGARTKAQFKGYLDKLMK